MYIDFSILITFWKKARMGKKGLLFLTVARIHLPWQPIKAMFPWENLAAFFFSRITAPLSSWHVTAHVILQSRLRNVATFIVSKFALVQGEINCNSAERGSFYFWTILIGPGVIVILMAKVCHGHSHPPLRGAPWFGLLWKRSFPGSASPASGEGYLSHAPRAGPEPGWGVVQRLGPRGCRCQHGAQRARDPAHLSPELQRWLQKPLKY